MTQDNKKCQCCGAEIPQESPCEMQRRALFATMELLTGHTKDRIQNAMPSGALVSAMCADNYFSENGWAVASKNVYDHVARQRKKDWQPEPFGEIHYANVHPKGYESPHYYLVVVSKNGDVVDVVNPSLTRLSDYDIHILAAIVPLKPDTSR